MFGGEESSELEETPEIPPIKEARRRLPVAEEGEGASVRRLSFESQRPNRCGGFIFSL